MTAAPIDNDNIQYTSSNDNPINKKRQHNRTQKRIHNPIDNDKVNSVIQTIHNQQNDSTDGLGDYKPLNPLRPPEIMREKKEGMSNLEKTINNTVSVVPEPINNENNALHSLDNTFMNDEEVKRYYNRLLANYQNISNNDNQSAVPIVPSQNYKYNNSNLNLGDTNQVLIDKLNYMINLLEEKQDEKTNNVTEEVVLYSFLGVFIIFIVDSFARVGKYVR